MVRRLIIPLLLAAALPTYAVVVSGGSGTQNVTAPTGTGNDFGFANVGVLLGANNIIDIGAVYLGDGWMLTAYHGAQGRTGVQTSGVVLDGSVYSVDWSTMHRLQTDPSTPADLALFKISGTPNLPSLTIASAAPTDTLAVSMMGFGFNRETGLTRWDIDGNNVWTESATPPHDAQGYKWDTAGRSLRWGTNNVGTFNGGAATANLDDGYGITTSFLTVFNNQAGEAQATIGDSGGGVFWKEGGQWRLGGIMLAVGNALNQPPNTSVYGDVTYAANLSTYKDQITAIVPEPASVGLVVLGGMVLAGYRRRRG